MFENDDTRKAGEELGAEAATLVDRLGERFCAAERQRIETENRSMIKALSAKLAVLKDEEQDIQKRIFAAPPANELRTHKRRTILLYSITALLTIAAFVFSVLAFDPFRLGWKAWLYCLGIAVVTPFLVDLILERWASPRLVTALTTIAGVVAVASLTLLAVVRGDLLMQQAASSTSAVVVAGDASATPEAASDFYDRTLPLLRIIMALLSIAIEVGAGIAFYEARRLGAWGEDITVLRQELANTRELMIVHGHQLWTLENEGEAFEHEFWRDFYRSVLNGARQGAMRKLLLLVLCVGLLGHSRAFAADHMNLVILLDLSQSVAAAGHDRKAEFDKNVDSVGSILATAPAGSRITVLGITDDSFSTPYVILKAQLTDDEGYFKERVAKGRAALTHAWAERSAKLTPDCRQTDILGALLVASEVFHASESDRKVLIVLSDMRQATSELDLERQPLVSAENALQRLAPKKLLADLAGVEVFLLGVDGAGKSPEYWHSLRSFWMIYFGKCGAAVKRYAVLRDLPLLAQH